MPTLQNVQTYTICRQQPTNCSGMFYHFVGLALKGINTPLSRNQKHVQSQPKRLRTKPANIYQHILSNRSTRKKPEKTLKKRLWKNFTPFSSVSIAYFQQLNVGKSVESAFSKVVTLRTVDSSNVDLFLLLLIRFLPFRNNDGVTLVFIYTDLWNFRNAHVSNFIPSWQLRFQRSTH